MRTAKTNLTLLLRKKKTVYSVYPKCTDRIIFVYYQRRF